MRHKGKRSYRWKQQGQRPRGSKGGAPERKWPEMRLQRYRAPCGPGQLWLSPRSNKDSLTRVFSRVG